MVKDSSTEKLIKQTAKHIFLTEGKMLATTQDIADAAGVNRTLLHYYFRSRDALFDLVFKEAIAKLKGRISDVLRSSKAFRVKIEDFIDVFFEELKECPYLETFIIVQVNQDKSKCEELFSHSIEGKEMFRNFLLEIKHEMNEKRIPAMEPVHFFMNLFSLMAYPMVARPLYLDLLNIDEEGFSKIIKQRKKVILTLLFSN